MGPQGPRRPAYLLLGALAGGRSPKITAVNLLGENSVVGGCLLQPAPSSTSLLLGRLRHLKFYAIRGCDLCERPGEP